MAELPSPPSLDLDGAPPGEPVPAPAAQSVAKPKPVPAPEPAPATPRQVPPPSPAEAGPPPPPDEEEETDGEPPPAGRVPTQVADVAREPRAVPAPGTPPQPTDHPPREVRHTGVQDSVEEVLQQTSAQTLQLSHLEDILTALNQTLNDLQDEMHAGFAEIRAVTESVATGEGARRTEVAGGESLTQRIEFMEEQALDTNKKQSLLTILAIAQAVLLVILLVVVLAGMRSNGPTTELPDADYTMTPSSHSTETEVKKPPPLPVEDTRKKKKRRKR